MFSFSFDPEVYSNVRRQELLKEAQQYRLVQEALRSKQSQAHSTAKILVFIGGLLVDFGTALEKRYSIAYSTATPHTQVETSGCC